MAMEGDDNDDDDASQMIKLKLKRMKKTKKKEKTGDALAEAKEKEKEKEKDDDDDDDDGFAPFGTSRVARMGLASSGLVGNKKKKNKRAIGQRKAKGKVAKLVKTKKARKHGLMHQ